LDLATKVSHHFAEGGDKAPHDRLRPIDRRDDGVFDLGGDAVGLLAGRVAQVSEGLLDAIQ